MDRIEVELQSGSYPVWVGSGLLQSPEGWLSELPGGGRQLVVTDSNVAETYLQPLLQALGRLDFDCRHYVTPAGESNKSLDTWRRIIDHLVAIAAGRDARVLALGGGVVGDLAGFAAAAYMRGIEVIQLPTTLLAQVDASVGGKTGANLPAGKNLVGAFHQPRAVVADIATLATLPVREFRAGLAEALKYGAIRDPELFTWIEANTDSLGAGDSTALQHLVAAAVTHKAAVVAADERERGERALLNFGHTIGHALESVTGYERYLHGEAVAIGMVLAARISERLGLCAEGAARRIDAVLARIGLPTSLPAQEGLAERLMTAMRYDKKNRAERMRLVLLQSIGCARVSDDCPPELVAQILSEATRERSNRS